MLIKTTANSSDHTVQGVGLARSLARTGGSNLSWGMEVCHL